MDWKDIDLVEPLRKSILPIGKKSKQAVDLLNLLNPTISTKDKVFEYLKSEWSNLCGPASKRSIPVKIEFENLFLSCESASARQDIVMRWPRIQSEIQKRFSYRLKSVRFDNNLNSATNQTVEVVLHKSKINELNPKQADINKEDLSLIQDIREILKI